MVPSFLDAELNTVLRKPVFVSLPVGVVVAEVELPDASPVPVATAGGAFNLTGPLGVGTVDSGGVVMVNGNLGGDDVGVVPPVGGGTSPDGGGTGTIPVSSVTGTNAVDVVGAGTVPVGAGTVPFGSGVGTSSPDGVCVGTVPAGGVAAALA